MTNRLLEKLSAAGFESPKRALLLGIAAPLALGGLLQEWLAVPGLSLAGFAVSVAFEYEVLELRASLRQRRIFECWPIVLESLESAAIAGLSLVESLRDLADSEQLVVAKDFAECCRDLDSGLSFDNSVNSLKCRLGTAASDFTMELLRATNALGSSGYVSAIRNQSAALRADLTLASELAAKQGWVVGTAKLAVLAPWLIVLILSFRPENSQLYASTIGTSVLIIGLIASAVALRMVYQIGNLRQNSRVFA